MRYEVYRTPNRQLGCQDRQPGQLEQLLSEQLEICHDRGLDLVAHSGVVWVFRRVGRLRRSGRRVARFFREARQIYEEQARFWSAFDRVMREVRRADRCRGG